MLKISWSYTHMFILFIYHVDCYLIQLFFPLCCVFISGALTYISIRETHEEQTHFMFFYYANLITMYGFAREIAVTQFVFNIFLTRHVISNYSKENPKYPFNWGVNLLY